LELRYRGVAYDGWADAASALRQAYPGIDNLAWRSVDMPALLDSMTEARVFDALPAPNGGWDAVWPVSIIPEPLAPAPLIAFDGALPAWFRSFPIPEQRASPLLAKLPVTVRFRLGTSSIARSLLETIEIGDALLIQRNEQIATVNGKPLCRYHYRLEEIMLERQFDGFEPDSLEPNGDGYGEERTEDTDLDDDFKIDDLPVRLEFVLHDATMRFADLSQLYTGALLNIESSATSNVKVRANGRLVATGELVEVGEQLAVQLLSVRFAAKR
jgi:type III secretion protein Q